jgi:hypothetical protein
MRQALAVFYSSPKEKGPHTKARPKFREEKPEGLAAGSKAEALALRRLYRLPSVKKVLTGMARAAPDQDAATWSK